MDKLKKVGLTALAGTFAISSAQALEMSASGSAGFTYSSSDSDEVTGERFSFGDSITLSGSGETDMGWTVTASYELDDGSTPYDDQTVSIATDSGTFYVQTNAEKGGAVKLTPNTYGSASYSLASRVTETANHLSNGVTGTTNVGYNNADIAGFDVTVGMSPGAVGGSDIAIAVKKADVVDGMTVGVSVGEIDQADANNASQEVTLSASYAMGGMTFGVTKLEITHDKSSSSDIEALHVGASFAVNDDLSVSVDRSTADNALKAVDETITSYQASYTMGSMTIKGHFTSTDNVAYSSGDGDENKAIAVSFAF